MSYEVRLDQFNGPLDKLLELVEEKKLEPTQVSLAAVTADFIKYVEQLEKEQGVETSILADFVVVAARLLVIKSKVLLPSLELTEEEKVDVADLENRLKIYQQFRLASVHIKNLWDKNQVAQSRPLLAALGDSSFFYPPKGVGANEMVRSLRALFTVLQGLIPETKKIKLKVITLQEKIAELTQRLSQAASVSFKGALKTKDRQEVIVLFLAVLHMLANRLAEVEQGNTFGDIIVKSTNNESVTNKRIET